MDGNHEVWPSLDRFAETEGYRAALEAGKPAHLGGSLWWALRGSVWEWGDLTFGALGGAVSPDKHVAGNRWADAEATKVEDLDRLLANSPEGGLDVLLTHDAPTQVRGVLGNKIFSVPTYIEIEADESRRLLARAVNETMPSVLVHGHWHMRNWEQINDETLVVGLSNNLRHGFHRCCGTPAESGGRGRVAVTAVNVGCQPVSRARDAARSSADLHVWHTGCGNRRPTSKLVRGLNALHSEH